MNIKVFISQPRDENAGSKRIDLGKRFDALVDGIDITYEGEYPLPVESDYVIARRNISAIADCDFAVFANGWDGDKRCHIEKSVAEMLGIPSCGESEEAFSQLMWDYVTKQLGSKTSSCSKKGASTALDRLADLQESQCNISQGTFVIEEGSELIKELTKSQRGKSNEKEIRPPRKLIRT